MTGGGNGENRPASVAISATTEVSAPPLGRPFHENGDSGNVSRRAGEPLTARGMNEVRGPRHLTSDAPCTCMARRGEESPTAPLFCPSVWWPRESTGAASKGGLKLTKGWLRLNGEPSTSIPGRRSVPTSSLYENGGVESVGPGGARQDGQR